MLTNLFAMLHSIHRMVQIFRKHWKLTLWTILFSATILLSPLFFYLVQKNVSLAFPSSPYDTLVVYFSVETTDETAQKIRQQLAQEPVVKKVQLHSKQASLSRLKASGDEEIEELLALLPNNPLPAKLYLFLDPSSNAYAAEQALRRELLALPAVERISSHPIWLERLKRLKRFILHFAIFSAILGTGGVVLAIGNTIRLFFESHRDDIDIHALLGAPIGFVRRPFLYCGAILGGVTLLFAVLLIQTSLLWLTPSLSSIAQSYDINLSLALFSKQQWLMLTVIGALMGILAAWTVIKLQWPHINGEQ